MARSDTQGFLIDLFARFDPNMDLSEGSRAYTELIEPILLRVGGDPFDDDIHTFLRARITQVRPELAISDVDELTDLLIDPMRILIEPVTRELQLVKLRTSLRNLNVLADDEVDALMGNFFESRRAGGFAVGVGRLYFAAPQSVSVTLINVAQSRSGYRYIVPRPQAITADQMLLNIEGSAYYFDINLIAENRGEEYNIERGELNSIANMPSVIRVTNMRRFSEGVVRESNADFVARVQQSTSDKTLTTEPGNVAVLKESFAGIRQMFSIGFGDPEMKRDLLRGGSLGAIPEDDDLGKFYGTASPIDDLDADATTTLISTPSGNFITRLGAAGSTPEGWYATLIYSFAGELQAVDALITQVVSDTTIRVDHEIPLALAANQVTWMLRQKKLTVSGLPGGIVMPNTPAGTLELPNDAVHIGGRTDVFISGDTELVSAQIIGLTDEKPLARGVEAQTQALTDGAEDVVLLPDISPGLFARVRIGMSLVLAEGSDVGAYRIVEVIDIPRSVRVDAKMTGEQGSLLWKIVDEIDVDLIQPKDVLLEGADLILAAGSPTAIVAGGTNFQAAGIKPKDVLFLDLDQYGGDFTVTEVTATTLTLDPPSSRAVAGAHYVISRRSEGVQRPVLRVKSLELLDSAGAPNGTVIPYRDPVLCLSNAFQAEGKGYLYDGPAFLGLLSVPLAGSVAAALKTLIWETRDPALGHGAPAASGTFTFGISGGADLLAKQINANAVLRAQGVRAVVLSYAGQTHLGITSQKLVSLVGGTILPLLGWEAGASNAGVRVTTNLKGLKVRRGDLVEFVGGNNVGLSARILTEPTDDNYVALGFGPFGPPGVEALYDLATLSPDPGGRIRIARPSVGSVRCYFLEPTSVNFGYRDTRFEVVRNGQRLIYQPDPENTRTLIPSPPLTALPTAAVLDSTTRRLSHTDTNFLTMGIEPGDLVEVLYRPISSTDELDPSASLAVGGKTLVLQLDNDPFLQVAFPFAMTSTEVPAYINEQLGMQLASLVSNHLVLQASRRVQVIPTSTVLSVIPFDSASNDHPAKGVYIVQRVSASDLILSEKTPLPEEGDAVIASFRIRRYLQRISATEMNQQVDASGLYYVDVEAVAVSPGDHNDIGTGIELTASGYRSDGYRLLSDTPELSYSRAEDLRAEISRTLLLVGASDNPTDYVQVNLQNVQVTYERSALVDEVQSFCGSRYRRNMCQDILVRHLLPHYVSLNWRYAGGAAEPEMVRAFSTFLQNIEGGSTFEVGQLKDVLTRKQATSVFAVDPTASNGRSAPLALVVRHSDDRKVQASLVRDVVDTVRMATFLPDNIVLRRLSAAGLR